MVSIMLWLIFQLIWLTVKAESPRIVGGQETAIAHVPYLVYLQQRGEFICGGSLLTTSCVLSAAHCVYGQKPGDYKVIAGASRLDETHVIERDVAIFHIAHNYEPKNFDMDVAILKLKSPVQQISGKVATISACQKPPPNNAYVRISGWGITKENNRQPAEQVRTANVRVVPRMECQLSYAGQAQLSDSMLCAAIRGIKDSCSGDSGGPLVYRGQVCGIVSWGFGCARSEYPGVYTSVASKRVSNFIEQTLREQCGFA